jgi:hypothetical protein
MCTGTTWYSAGMGNMSMALSATRFPWNYACRMPSNFADAEGGRFRSYEASRSRRLPCCMTQSASGECGVAITVDTPLRDELRARQRTWTELQLQAGRVETQQIFKERVLRRSVSERASGSAPAQSTAGQPVPGARRAPAPAAVAEGRPVALA